MLRSHACLSFARSRIVRCCSSLAFVRSLVHFVGTAALIAPLVRGGQRSTLVSMKIEMMIESIKMIAVETAGWSAGRADRGSVRTKQPPVCLSVCHLHRATTLSL